LNIKKKIYKKLYAGICCAAMILAGLNLPAFNQTVYASVAHTAVNYTLSKNSVLTGGGQSVSLYANKRIALYKGDTVTVNTEIDSSGSPIVRFIGITFLTSDGISVQESFSTFDEGYGTEEDEINAITKFTVTSDFPMYLTYAGGSDSKVYGTGPSATRFQTIKCKALTFSDSKVNLQYSLDGGTQNNWPSQYDIADAETIYVEAPVKKGHLVRTLYDNRSMFNFTPMEEENGYRKLYKISLRDLSSIDTSGFNSSSDLSNVTLTCTWKTEAGSGTIGYNANGGLVNGQTEYIRETGVNSNNKISDKVVPTREGYVFEGWYSNAEGTGDPVTYVIEGEKEEDLAHYKVYAKWEVAPHTHVGVKVNQVNATCKEYGVKEYYECECGKFFTDAACTNEIEDLAAWKNDAGRIAKLTTHTTVKVNQENATCTKYGVKAYYKCSVCGKYFSDSTCKNEIKDLTAWKAGSGRIAKTAHENVLYSRTPATTTSNGTKTYKCSVCGTKTSPQTIYAARNVSISCSKYTYNGKEKKPAVTVKDSKGNVVQTSNYTVSYTSGRKNVGSYTVTITFKNDYKGSAKKTYVINPSKTAISSLTAGKKAFVAKWTKKSTQVTGYQIQYSTSSTFASGNKTVKVSSYKTVSTTVKSLTGGKKYYVRIRTYKTVGKTNYYSDWSAAKAVTTKK